MPREIEKKYPDWWLNDNEEGGKNLYEDQLFSELVRRTFRKELKFEYLKITSVSNARLMQDNILNYLKNDLTIIVYNFIDMLSHARTEMEVLKELAGRCDSLGDLTDIGTLLEPLTDLKSTTQQ